MNFQNTFEMKLKGRIPDVEYSHMLAAYLPEYRNRPMKEIGAFIGKLLAWKENKVFIYFHGKSRVDLSSSLPSPDGGRLLEIGRKFERSIGLL